MSFMQVEWKVESCSDVEIEFTEHPEWLVGYCVKYKTNKATQKPQPWGVAIVCMSQGEEFVTEKLISAWPSFGKSGCVIWSHCDAFADFDNDTLGQLCRRVNSRCGGFIVFPNMDKELLQSFRVATDYGGRDWVGDAPFGVCLSMILRSCDYVDSGRPIELLEFEEE